MAMEAGSNSSSPSPQMVGNVFVEQYYHILHTSPELVHRFYQDTSVLSRPGVSGEMVSVTTMKGINEKILSLNFKEYKAEIKTADAQKSFMKGVTVLVTGSLTDQNNLKRKFVQLFFLAPQDNGYFVLNDVFRFVEDDDPSENITDKLDTCLKICSAESDQEQHKSSMEVEKNVDEGAASRSEKQISCLTESVVSIVIEDSLVCEPESLATEEDAPKKSYASIVKVAKGSSTPLQVYVPTNKPNLTPNKSNVQVSPAMEPEPPSSTTNNNVAEDSSEPEGHSICIRNLPRTVTADQLEAQFTKFGPIKPDGIQVRFNKQHEYCYGFVEFLSLTSFNSALQASPVTIEGRQVVIEVKKAPGKGGLGSGRGVFRNENLRGRGGYSGGRNFGRSFSGHGDVYNPRGRGGRPSGYRQYPNFS